jgi:outer membrane protein OmpA-like peptidoglycan-associated protein
MSMKSARPRAFVALLALSFASPAFAQTAGAPTAPPEDEPTPPSMQPPPVAPPMRTRAQRPATSASATTGYTSEDLEPARPTGPVPDSFLPSLMGPIGLYHLSTAEVGPVNHLRLALHFDYFKSSKFLIGSPDTNVDNDENSRVQGSLSFGYTPQEYVELFGAMLTSSNRNVRSAIGEPPRRDPELIKSFGDLVLGAKTALPVAKGMKVGFEAGFRFLSGISDLSVSPSSTSLWFGPLYTVDLRPLAHAPLRFHAKVDYYVDNSKNLIDFSDPTISIYTREVASFAYGIAKSRVRFGLGFDVPLEQITAPVPLDIFGEYHAEIVTVTGDAAFAKLTPANRDQQWFTLGVRARVFHGLTVDLGADVRLSSVGYEYGPPLPPYLIRGGVSFPLDIDAFTKPTIITKTVEHAVASGPSAPLEAQVAGVVKSARDGKGVPNAVVSVVNKPLSRVGTDPDGSFQTIMLAPGPAVLDVTAPGFEAARVTAAVHLGAPARIEIALTPRVMTGNVRGKVTDSKGQPLQASIRFSGAEAFSAQADASGAFSAALPVGPYKVIAEMPTMPAKEVSLDIVEGQDKTLDIVMRAPNGNVSLEGDVVKLKSPLKFKGPAKLDAKMQSSLDAVAELLQDHAELRVLKVDAYWDSSAGPKAKATTDAQAKAIKDYLVKKGVAEGRIEAQGHGAENPLVPNIGPVNKAKNRRVELHVAQ